MKKLNLNEQDALTRDQMKKIVGGFTSGCGVTVGGELVGFLPCNGSVCDCQDAMDLLCEVYDTCDNIDCGCQN